MHEHTVKDDSMYGQANVAPTNKSDFRLSEQSMSNPPLQAHEAKPTLLTSDSYRHKDSVVKA